MPRRKLKFDNRKNYERWKKQRQTLRDEETDTASESEDELFMDAVSTSFDNDF